MNSKVNREQLFIILSLFIFILIKFFISFISLNPFNYRLLQKMSTLMMPYTYEIAMFVNLSFYLIVLIVVVRIIYLATLKKEIKIKYHIGGLLIFIFLNYTVDYLGEVFTNLKIRNYIIKHHL
jgi:uncharacterized protein YhhL (DUF1145 family)